MKDDGVFKQARIENEALLHAKDALLGMIAWPIEGTTFTRKLSGVRFLTGSLQNQLDRLFAIEERDGYMQYVRDTLPHYTERVERLRKQHQQLREMVSQATVKLERILPEGLEAFNAVCNELKQTLTQLEQHSKEETKLLQTASSEDIGGEGG